MMDEGQIIYRCQLLLCEVKSMMRNKPRTRKRIPILNWERKMDIIFNRIDRLLGKNGPKKEPLDMEAWYYCGNNLALFEEYYQEPPFNRPVTLTGNITLLGFIKKWCIFEHKNTSAEADKIYHYFRRLSPFSSNEQVMIEKILEQLKKALVPFMKNKKAIHKMQTFIDRCYLERFERYFISLPTAIVNSRNKRGHTIYRECDLYFAWRHYQRANKKLNLPNLRPYGEVLGWQTAQVNTNQFVLRLKIRIF